VALVGEARGGGGCGDAVATLEQAAGGSDAVGDVQRVGWQAGPLAEETDQAELADAGGGGELVEADVALRPVTEIVAGCAKRLVVTRVERRSLGRSARPMDPRRRAGPAG